MAWLGWLAVAVWGDRLRRRSKREMQRWTQLASDGKRYGTRGRWVDTPTGRRSW
jgi:hypothetical protein